MEYRLLYLQVQVGIAVLLVLLARAGMRKLPRVYSYMLWLLVFARMLFPVSLECRFGLMPSATAGILWLEESFGGADPAAESQSTDSTGAAFIGSEAYAAPGYISEGAEADGSGSQGAKGTTNADLNAYIGGTQTSVSGYQDGNGGANETTRQNSNMQESSQETRNPHSNPNAYLQPEDISGMTGPDESRQPSILRKVIPLILWVMGTTVILACNGTVLLLVKKKIRGAEHFEDNIYVCSQVRVPFTLGIFCPKIYLPSNLEKEERDYIICHEKVHIRRKDYLAKNIAFLLTAINWFNPFVWVAFYFMERDMEMSCDEKVIRVKGEGIKKQYSQSLLNFAEGKYPVAMTPITFGENSVKQRVSNVLAYKTASKWVAVCGTVILFVLAVMLFTVRSDAQEQTREPQDGVGQDTVSQERGAVSGEGSYAQISSESSGYVIRDIGASAEISSLNLMMAQTSPEKVLECWARAFIDRNGDALFWLASDKDSFKQWDMVVQRGDDRFAFGESSPWAYDYETEIALESDAAEITFYMCTSVPEIYLLKEKVKITELEGLYYVDHDGAWNNYRIETAQEYRETYGEDAVHDELGIHGGNNVYGQMAALYDDSFYRAILTQLLNGDNKGFYYRFTSPVSAARELLHLGEGTGEVTEWDMMPAAGLRSVDVVRPAGSSAEPPYWIDALSTSGEGSRVIVSYTFAKDGTCVEIPMELKEGSQGIWGLAGGSIREIYSRVSESNMIEHEEGKADLTYVIELSNYGIYRFGAHSGLTCLWAGDVGPEADVRVYEDELYIFESAGHAGESSDGEADMVYVLELLTGELHREHLAVPQNYENTFPGVDFGIEGGLTIN